MTRWGTDLAEGDRRRRWLLPLLGTSLVLLGTLFAFAAATASRSWRAACYQSNTCDSLTFAVTAELLGEGKTPYDSGLRRQHIAESRLGGRQPPFDLPFQYPPSSLPMFAWRSWPSAHAAHLGNAIVTSGLFLFLLLLLATERTGAVVSSLLFVAGVSFSGALAFNAQLGQTGALAAALLTGTVLLWRRHELAAGLLLGLLAFKPQYALPLLALAVLRGQRSIYLGSAMTLSALALSSGLAFGFGRWLEFFRVVGQTNPTVPFMVNWMGLAWRVSPGNPMIEQLAIPVYLSVIALFLGGVWKFRNHSSVESQLSLAVALTLVASPNTHPYDLLVLTPALFYVGGRRGGAMAGLLFFLATWLLLPGVRRWALSLLLLLFAALCAARLWREVGDEGEATNVGA